jgi:hypothetical protein
MIMIRFVCRHCGEPGAAPDAMAGRRQFCRVCGAPAMMTTFAPRAVPGRPLDRMTPGRWACLAGAWLLASFALIVLWDGSAPGPFDPPPTHDQRFYRAMLAMSAVVCWPGAISCLIAAAFHRPTP